MEISLDNLPIKRLDAIEENGLEKFPPDIDYDQKRLDLIRRIDFGWAVEKDEEKKKQKLKEIATPAATTWPFQSLVENLQLARQELSVIVDVINTVEANDAVTVAGMTRPKQLPNEVLSDVSVSTATKLQCFRNVSKYFKQSVKALERQVAREARFYGALIRLQQNWKIKRQRMSVAAPANEGFTIDLFDNTSNPTAVFRPPSISTVHIDHDSSGMLAVHLPPKSCRSIQFGFLDDVSGCKLQTSGKINIDSSSESSPGELDREGSGDEDVDECVKGTHSVLREVHRSIFDEQIFESVNREAFNPSQGVNVIGIRENYIELGIGQGASIYLSLAPTGQDTDQMVDSVDDRHMESSDIFETLEDVKVEEEKPTLQCSVRFPSPINSEIYLQQIFHEIVFARVKERRPSASRAQIVSGHPSGDGVHLLGHFCKTLAHRIFSSKVLAQLENLASRVSYLHLLSYPTWHSRTSSWLLSVKVPQAILHAGSRGRLSDVHSRKDRIRSQFHTKVVVIEDCISVEGECTPNVVGLFKGGGVSDDICSINSYDCELADLSMILLQQVATQVVRWLHEEALLVGMKASRDFLCLSLELDQGDRLCLVAHVDPQNTEGCISWWLVMADALMEESKLHTGFSNSESGTTKFLGYLSLETLYSILMDLVSLCSSGVSQ